MGPAERTLLSVDRVLERVDWMRTPVGPRPTWAGAMLAALSMLKNVPTPAFLFWGPEFVTFYNDAARALLGDRHPEALGARGRDVFARDWETVAPMLNAAYDCGTTAVARLGMHAMHFAPVYDGESAGGVFVSAIDRGAPAGVDEEFSGEQALMERFADVIPQMMWISDPHGKRLFQNKSWSERTGYRTLDDSALTIHPDDREETLAHWRYSVATGTPFAHDYRLWNRGDRRYGWVHGRAQPIVEGSRIVRWIGITSDIDRRKREEFAIAFLSNASARLNATLDPVSILREAAGLPLGVFADYAFAYVIGDGRTQRVAALHADPQKQHIVDEMVDAVGDPRFTEQSARTLEEGEPMLYRDIDDETLASWAQSAAKTAAMIRGDLRSMIRAPIEVAGKVVGAISVCRTSDSPRFDATDVHLMTELTRRTSIALANADIYQREHRIALSFQDAAMPRALAGRPGVAIRGHYVPGQSDARVGGDWYDAATLPDGRIVLSIGDVSGSGLEAAVVMSMVRPAIRSAAFIYADPVHILQAADAVVRADAKGHFVTAFVGIIDPVTMDWQYSNAGHPPPLLLHEGIVEEAAAAANLPLGVLPYVDRTAAHERLPASSSLLLYTDGLVEGEGAFAPGFEALVATLATPAYQAGVDPRELYRAMLPRGSRDDTAILSLRFERDQLEPHLRCFEAEVAEDRDAARMREDVCSHLRTLHLGNEALEDARLAIGEIVANIARHAPGPASIVVDATTENVVVHVLDTGPGFVYRPQLPPNTFSEGGRGVFIATALAHHFTVSPLPGGGSHIRLVFIRTP